MMKRLFLIVGVGAGFLAFAPSPARAQVEVGCTCYCGIQLNPPCSEYACKSACGYSSSGTGTSLPSEPVNIAWGRVSRNMLERAKTCTNPICTSYALMALPVGLLWDLPVWTVQGVGYLGKGLVYVGKNAGKGLVYAGKGVGKGLGAAGRGVGRGIKATGSAIASPFKRDVGKIMAAASATANCSAASVSGQVQASDHWDVCKKGIFKRQRALTKLNPNNKETERWCKKNVPLSSGPQRFQWETRCNPGVGAVMVDPPFTDPLNSPSPTTAAQLNAGNPSAGPKTEAPAPRSREEIAAEAKAIFDMQEAGLAAREASAAASGPAAANAATLQPDPATLALAGMSNAQAAQATPLPAALRSLGTVAQNSPEDLKGAAQDGFDGKGALLVKGGAAVPQMSGSGKTLAPVNIPEVRGQSQAAAPAGAKVSPAAQPAVDPTAVPTRVVGIDVPAINAAASAAAAAKMPFPEGALTGDPNRYKAFLNRQNGNTCAINAILQLLGEQGKKFGERELLWDAFQKGFVTAGFVCDNAAQGAYCRAVFDPATGSCGIADQKGNRIAAGQDFDGTPLSTMPEICQEVRRKGGLLPKDIGDYLALKSGKKVVNSMVPGPAELSALTNTDDRLTHARYIMNTVLPQARAELVEALKKGKGVVATMNVAPLYNRPLSRGMHSILVTAAVLDPSGGVLGYYINDSATVDHARFIGLEQFEKAWMEDDLQRVYFE